MVFRILAVHEGKRCRIFVLNPMVYQSGSRMYDGKKDTTKEKKKA